MAQPVELRSPAGAPATLPAAVPAAGPPPEPEGRYSKVPQAVRDFFGLPTFLTGPRQPARVPALMAPAAPALPPPLKPGDTGSRVTELQQLLQQAGFYFAEPTGRFDAATKRALLDFQQAYVGPDGAQLGVDGLAGETTLNALRLLKRLRKEPQPAGTPAPEHVAPSFYQVGQVETLALGSHGPDVQRAKALLKALGYDVSPTDVFDDAMRTAVADFQQRYKRMTGRWVETDSKIGPTTGFAMANAVESTRESPISWLEFTQRVETQTAQPAPATQPPATPPGPHATSESQVPNLGKPVLQAGSSDKAQVAELQHQLVTLGYGLTADGDYGAATTAAVADFQRLYALFTGEPLAADGACGDSTRRALAAAVSSGLMQRLPAPLRHGTLSVGYERGVPYTIVTRQLGDNDGGSLETRAALAYYAMHAVAGRADAHFDANESFRTNARQTELWRRFRSQPGRAARPGWSTHQSGIAIDASGDDEASSQWLVRNAKAYGFILPGYVYSSGGHAHVESWHWEYRVDRLTNEARAFYGLPELHEDPRPTAPPPPRRRRGRHTRHTRH